MKPELEYIGKSIQTFPEIMELMREDKLETALMGSGLRGFIERCDYRIFSTLQKFILWIDTKKKYGPVRVTEYRYLGRTVLEFRLPDSTKNTIWSFRNR